MASRWVRIWATRSSIRLVRSLSRFSQMMVQFSALRLRAMGHHSLLIWVLSGNQAEGFYQHLGGKKLRTTPTKVGRQDVEEVAYAWPDTLPLL